jgi:hypothetical protein
MSKTFRYTRINSRAYDSYRDSYEDDGVDFDYSVDNDEMLPVIANFLFEDYFENNPQIIENKELTKSIKEGIRQMIKENDLIDIFAETYEDWLKEIFRDDAMDWFNS